MEERKLVILAKKGDKKALEQLLKNNYSVLKGYLLKLTLDESLADDITQETMLKVILNIKKYKLKGKFSTWLITIATNVYRDILRKNKKVIYRGEQMRAVDVMSLEESVIVKTDFDRLKLLLKELPEEKRMVFILKHYYGYSYDEIAQIMKCSPGTVRSRLHYCIEKIRHQMKGGR
ncbi:RNA polymerase sigma factor SigY [Caloranaerobacter ferrireducens]|uniref:RNA polymerase sigma factor SigY n=1 Tax=Caloranaerobacter ferrireducens TaxID=1323370 RepID=UPI00084DFAFB|nr:RNA polymerase sigma factor SigY [Caloranaerobacter ferrireducens]